jgi:hypothetical protein
MGNLALHNSNDKDLLERIDHVENLVVRMGSKLDKIFDVVVGNETFDQEGLLSRIKRLEAESVKLNALKNKLIGAFIAGGATWTILWELAKMALKN